MGLIGLLAASLVACASSSDKPVTKADSCACGEYHLWTYRQRRRRRAARPQGAASTPKLQAKVYLEKVLPRFNRQLDEIAKLEPPKADRARVKGIIGADPP